MNSSEQHCQVHGLFSPCYRFQRTWPSDYIGFHVITHKIDYFAPNV